MIAKMSVQFILALEKIRMLKLVDSTSLSFVDASRIGSNPFSDIFYKIFCIYIDPFVQWLRLNIFNVLIRVQTPYGLKQKNRGYSLIGKTAILHIVNLGSSPDISKIF
jgi:hypothetical protein